MSKIAKEKHKGEMKNIDSKKLGVLVVMLLTVFTVSAYDFEVNGLCYNVLSENKKTVEVTYSLEHNANKNYVAGCLDIPQSVEYSGNIYTITQIGDKSFYNCTNLTSVNIPNTVTTIGRYSFYGCSGLTSIIIPNSVINLYEAAFRECIGLTSIILGESLTGIGNGAFCQCESLTSVKIPNSVYYIDRIAFSGCTRLSSVIIGDAVTSVGESAFGNCISLTSVTFGNSVSTIREYAFDGCIGLTSILIPSPVNTIEREAFRNCTGLTSVTIGNSVTHIGWWAFRGCTRLTSVTIPSSVSIIESPIFPACKNLLNINVSEDNKNYCSFDGILYSKDLKKLKECPDGKDGVVNINNTVTTIGQSAFGDCTELTSIIIPNSVINIEQNAFDHCNGLTTINIPNSVISIGDYVFYQCINLSSITIGNSVGTIGLGAFYGCYSLSKIYCTPEMPPAAYYNPFDYSILNNTYLYVPVGCMSEYQQIDPWKNFKNLEEMNFTSSIREAVIDGEMVIIVHDGTMRIEGVKRDETVEVFNMLGYVVVRGHGNISANLPRGIYLLRTSGKTIKFKV